MTDLFPFFLAIALTVICGRLTGTRKPRARRDQSRPFLAVSASLREEKD